MPVPPLEIRIHERIAAKARTVSGENVPPDRHYRRDVLAHSADRDAVPAVVVSRTPGRAIGERKLLACTEYQYPVTALLLDTAGGQVAAPSAKDWRVAWAPALLAALDGASPLWVGGDENSVVEIHYADLDALAILDLSAYEAAGLWQSALSVIVTVRRYGSGRTNET